MATDSAVFSIHKTLSGTTADTITLTGAHDHVEVINRGTGTVYFTIAPEGVTPTVAVAEADETVVVPAGAAVTVDSPGDRGTAISIVGNGDAYSIQAVTG